MFRVKGLGFRFMVWGLSFIICDLPSCEKIWLFFCIIGQFVLATFESDSDGRSYQIKYGDGSGLST